MSCTKLPSYCPRCNQQSAHERRRCRPSLTIHHHWLHMDRVSFRIRFIRSAHLRARQKRPLLDPHLLQAHWQKSQNLPSQLIEEVANFFSHSLVFIHKYVIPKITDKRIPSFLVCHFLCIHIFFDCHSFSYYVSSVCGAIIIQRTTCCNLLWFVSNKILFHC